MDMLLIGSLLIVSPSSKAWWTCPIQARVYFLTRGVACDATMRAGASYSAVGCGDETPRTHTPHYLSKVARLSRRPGQGSDAARHASVVRPGPLCAPIASPPWPSGSTTAAAWRAVCETWVVGDHFASSRRAQQASNYGVGLIRGSRPFLAQLGVMPSWGLANWRFAAAPHQQAPTA